MTRILYTTFVCSRHLVEVAADAALDDREIIEAAGEPLETDLPYCIPADARANDVIPFAAVLRRVV